ncbi:DUF397 domain-containing protein [Streptomyces sp. JJ36]|uniref:DUF397 domain-containing protein n=1 Tax=Streptomyces sp. JJ36 TaxID=2736645 RepID=UPI001F389003|nr:DUF397 domain-containing protein [Streptomyces sp. JJ36]MCF6524243.1 DUF397 domain-containing protein [Streptomyces sp. JJ36]
MTTTDLVWVKSTYSGGGGDNCVEVAVRPGAVLVRDTKDTRRPPLSASPEAWSAFAAYTAAGRSAH